MTIFFRVGQYLSKHAVQRSQSLTQRHLFWSKSCIPPWLDLQFSKRNACLTYSMSWINKTVSTFGSVLSIYVGSSTRLILSISDDFPWKTKDLYRIRGPICYLSPGSEQTYDTVNELPSKTSKERTVRLLDAMSGGLGIDKYVDFGDVNQSEWKSYYLKSIATHNVECSGWLSDESSSTDSAAKSTVAQTSDNCSTQENNVTGGMSPDEVLQKTGSNNCASVPKNNISVEMPWEALVDGSKLSHEELQIHFLHRDAVKNGEDFYVDPETGCYVTTRFSHLKRGECCGNVCRHPLPVVLIAKGTPTLDRSYAVAFPPSLTLNMETAWKEGDRFNPWSTKDTETRS